MKKKKKKEQPRGGQPALGEVVDLFCGVGALSHGLKRAGLEIVAGYDLDARCKYAFEINNDAEFIEADVANLDAAEIKRHFTGNGPSVLAGCAPCQPFSPYKQRYEEDPQWNLVTKLAKLAVQVGPDFVTMENVPALLRYKEGKVFRKFCSQLKRAGYKLRWVVAKCEEFGVPQKRRRLVVIASKKTGLVKLQPTQSAALSVRDAIGKLPKLRAGRADPSDRFHAASSLTPINMKRIRASKAGGTWRDWPKELRAACHRRSSGKTYLGVYGRMSWDQPSPTMTTQCYGFGNGRFGHPEQNRAISLREAAILQSFPKNYTFLPAEEKVSSAEIGRWIGNAVPVKLAEAIGQTIIKSHLQEATDGA